MESSDGSEVEVSTDHHRGYEPIEIDVTMKKRAGIWLLQLEIVSPEHYVS